MPRSELLAAAHRGRATACTSTRYSPEAGAELWQASALGEPARLLADIYPGPNGSYPVLLGNLDGELIFSADDGVSGTELWAPYDAGLIADLAPAPGASS